MKGVILAGGTGSRLHPLTRITNKHLLPIYDRPMVTYAIEACVQAGITQVMVVTGGTHAGEFLRLLGNGHEYGLDRLFYAYQERPGGIAEALGLAQRFVDGDRVVVILGDNIVEHSIRPNVERFERQHRGARVALAETKEIEHLQHLGVPEFDGNRRIKRIVEKPDKPASQYGVTGIYFYPAEVFDVIAKLKPSGRGELEITDVNNWFIAQGAMEYDVLTGFWGDAGESIDAYYAVNDFVRQNGANKPQTPHPDPPPQGGRVEEADLPAQGGRVTKTDLPSQRGRVTRTDPPAQGGRDTKSGPPPQGGRAKTTVTTRTPPRKGRGKT